MEGKYRKSAGAQKGSELRTGVEARQRDPLHQTTLLSLSHLYFIPLDWKNSCVKAPEFSLFLCMRNQTKLGWEYLSNNCKFPGKPAPIGPMWVKCPPWVQSAVTDGGSVTCHKHGCQSFPMVWWGGESPRENQGPLLTDWVVAEENREQKRLWS